MTTNGITADLESYAANGGGTTNLDLTALVPTKGQMGMNSQMKLSAAGQKLGMKLTLAMTLLSK